MRAFTLLSLAALVAAGCTNKDTPSETGTTDDTGVVIDEDGDGSPASEDCDDNDPNVFPENTETCDGVDNNCDGVVDEGVTTTWYADGDGDGYGPDSSAVEACSAPTGHVAAGGDCDDGNDEVYPNAAERCDELDNDCDGDVDEEVQTTWYADLDGDTYGDIDGVIDSCDPPEGFVSNPDDCDDAMATVYPGADEYCNAIDDDCDSAVDEGEAVDAPTWYADTDADAYGDADYAVASCEQPTGYVADATDCDDADGSVNPGATEVCNSVDDDCDGTTDEDDADDAPTWYADGDADGYGDPDDTTRSCSQPSGYVADSTDCDDSRGSVNPGADEYCNGLDDDCDGTTDEDDALDASTWYADADSDTYGDSGSTTLSCSRPSGYVADNTDCDDGSGAVHPGADEYCNSVDDDCDGTTDEDSAVDVSTWYADDDSDNYGDPDDSDVDCDQPSGYVADNTDCDDADALSNPGASELCDGVDNDCDTVVDNGVLGSGSACPAESCLEILDDGASAGDGTYSLYDSSSAVYDAYCDMTTDGGGWTLVGSVVNEALTSSGSAVRTWNSFTVWTDDTTFGSIANRATNDYKGEAFSEVEGDDFMVTTGEYTFGFYTLIGVTDFANFINAEYDPNACSTSPLADGADFGSANLTQAQLDSHVFIVRPLDSNCSCFPGCNENAIIGLQLASCCWTGGLGNCTSCQSSWRTHDLSLRQLSYLSNETCNANSYPCNAEGRVFSQGGFCYGTSCKSTYAEMYVR
ncbi:MAG: hypothetical protein H6739_27925 [Alphaproteobacteria bacterium]|nr:hypothetical protein [Alphaproteobacteria bacterium]